MPALATRPRRFGSIGSRLKNQANQPQPPGHFSFGTSLLGGPRFTDAFKSKQAPSLTQLVENYHAIIYAMVDRNRNAVARLPMRLLADGSRAQGKPSRACDAIKLSRAVGQQLAQSGQVSTAAIDQIYEIRNHPLLDVLDNPDPYGTFTREQLIGLLVAYMDVTGSAYLVPEGNGWDWHNPQTRKKGPPQALWVIYPQYVIPVRMSQSPIVQVFQYFSDRLPYDSTLWLRHTHSLRDAYGSAFSPTYAGEPYRQQEQEQVAILSQVLGLGPRPNLLASAKDPMMEPGEVESQAFAQDLVRLQSGGYAGGILVNRGGWDVTPLSYPPADLAGKEISEHDIYCMAAIFGQPATYYTVDTNLANLQAADAEYDKNGVQPRCRVIAGIMTRFAKMFDPRLMFKFDAGLEEDEVSKATVVDMRLKSGRTTINQENQDEKWPLQEWGDEPLIVDNMMPLSKIIEAHESSMKQADATIKQGEQGMESQKQSDVLAAEAHEQELAMSDQEMESREQEDVLAEDAHEHGKEIDKKKVAIDAKKATQKPAAKRSVEEQARLVLGKIEAELEIMRAG